MSIRTIGHLSIYPEKKIEQMNDSDLSENDSDNRTWFNFGQSDLNKFSFLVYSNDNPIIHTL